VAARGFTRRRKKMTGEICNGFLPSSLSSPAVTPTVTCNKKKEKRRQLILNHFFFSNMLSVFPFFRSVSSVGLFFFVSPSSLFQVAGGKEELFRKGHRCWGKEQRWLALLLLVRGRYC
jgi:hypothetical protein